MASAMTPSRRFWVERDLQPGDASCLRDFAFFRNCCPASAVVDRLCERGFFAKTTRLRPRVTLKGWSGDASLVYAGYPYLRLREPFSWVAARAQRKAKQPFFYRQARLFEPGTEHRTVLLMC